MAEVTLRHLRYLVALADELHFRRAAERLHLTQPALSHQIRQLEQILGVQLFDRDGRHVGLTPAGAALTADAHRLLADVERAVATTRRVGGDSITLRVCHSPSIRRILIPAMTAGMRGRAMPLDVLWIERSEEEVGAELLNARYDAVIGRYPPAEKGLEHETLLWERPGVYLNRRDPLASYDEVPLAALAGRRIRIVRPEAVRQHYEATMRDLRAAGLEGSVEPVMSYANWASAEMQREIEQDLCVVIGLASADGTLPGTTVRPLGPPATAVPLTISWKSGSQRVELEAFLELARSVVGALDEPWLAAQQ
jgi:DNA-binding transcriptional LysR family regulator